MRVGIVSYDFYPARGGQGRFTRDLWDNLGQVADLELRVFSPATNSLAGHVRVGRLASLGRGPGFSLVPSWNLDRWGEEYAIDLFHLNGGPGGVLLLRRPHVPYVYTAHHTYAQQARLVPGQAWKCVLAHVEARGYREARAVAADTASTSASLTSELGVAPERVTVIPSGVNHREFRPRNVSRLKDSVLFVGRLDARKGLQFLLEAWTHVVAAKPSARLYVVGDGPSRRAAERRVADLGLGGTVAFLGRVAQDRMATWFNQAACVAVPSIFEGFGLAAVEAIACGTPVVATDSEGLRDVVVEGVDGRLAPYGDAEAFAEALIEVIARGDRLARDRVTEIHQQYSWDRVAALYHAFYVAAFPANQCALGLAAAA